jgi:hypothetical protein
MLLPAGGFASGGDRGPSSGVVLGARPAACPQGRRPYRADTAVLWADGAIGRPVVVRDGGGFGVAASGPSLGR